MIARDVVDALQLHPAAGTLCLSRDRRLPAAGVGGVPLSPSAGRIAHPALRARATRSHARGARRLSPAQARPALRRRTCSRCVTRDAAALERLAGAARARPERAHARARPRRSSRRSSTSSLRCAEHGRDEPAERPVVDPAAVLADAARRARGPARGPARPRQHGRLRARRRRRRHRRRAHHRQPRSLAPRRAAGRRRAALRRARRPPRAVSSSSRERDRPLLAVDPDGDPLDPPSCPRARCSPSAPSATACPRSCSRRADARVSIPMRPGVSSLNLATSVAAVLFAWRLSARPPRRWPDAGRYAAASTPSSSASCRAAPSLARPPSDRPSARGRSTSAISSLDQLARRRGRARRRAARAPEVLGRRALRRCSRSERSGPRSSSLRSPAGRPRSHTAPPGARADPRRPSTPHALPRLRQLRPPAARRSAPARSPRNFPQRHVRGLLLGVRAQRRRVRLRAHSARRAEASRSATTACRYSAGVAARAPRRSARPALQRCRRGARAR